MAAILERRLFLLFLDNMAAIKRAETIVVLK
jgi:hypothetical protein